MSWPYAARRDSGELPVRLISPQEVGVEHRGKGRNQRPVHNILPDSQLADSLLVVEVYTNEGDTSSGPRTSTIRQLKAVRPIWKRRTITVSIHLRDSAYSASTPTIAALDECMAVYNRDVVKVPKGYHPVATIAGYDNYYLNVMAGPLRKWRFTGREPRVD